MNKKEYNDYLQSDEWKARRDYRLKKDGFRCAICGTGKNLQVHHITYERIQNELIDDLVTLCESCHNGVHSSDVVLEKRNKEHRKDLLIDKAFKKATQSISDLNPADVIILLDSFSECAQTLEDIQELISFKKKILNGSEYLGGYRKWTLSTFCWEDEFQQIYDKYVIEEG